MACVAITRQRVKLSPRHFMTIFFRVSRTFWLPNLWRPGVRFRSYITLCTCHVGPKIRSKMWFCVQNQCKLSFFHLVHINMHIFTLNCWNYLVFDLLCFKKCLPQISVKKTTKKVEKTKKYIRNSQNNKIHKKLILIPEFFSSTIAKNATKSCLDKKFALFWSFIYWLEQKVWFLA